ncbi:MAG TPA: Mpo1-like protein [Steroidobacteraceae bacterium]|nr:Mpo1-like protein [Steroidobacteraceae bacterium]
MRSTVEWLDEYSLSHRHPINEWLHFLCVPLIVWSLVGLLWCLPVPWRAALPYWANWATAAVAAAIAYYTLLSVPLAFGALSVLAFMLWSVDVYSHLAAVPLWMPCTAAFILAWIGQFIGHVVEKKRPSFFKDLQFLLIGPLWLLAKVYRRIGVAY